MGGFGGKEARCRAAADEHERGSEEKGGGIQRRALGQRDKEAALLVDGAGKRASFGVGVGVGVGRRKRSGSTSR